MCAWPGETGDPWGYEAAANFLTLTSPHTSDRVPVQAPARTNHSQDGQRGGACDAAQIPAPWGLNLPDSACALQQVLLVHGLHAASPSAPSKLRAGQWLLAVTFYLPLRSCRCAPRPPALSPALATSCEAARLASCAKARGEGGRVAGCKGNPGSAPRTGPLHPGARRSGAACDLKLLPGAKRKALAKSCPELLS